MSDLSRNDIRQAVRDEMNNLLNDIHLIRDASSRIDQRTSDLDNSQQQINHMATEMRAAFQDLQTLKQINPRDIQDIKLRVQNIEKGIAQIVQYLQSTEHERNQESKYRAA